MKCKNCGNEIHHVDAPVRWVHSSRGLLPERYYFCDNDPAFPRQGIEWYAKPDFDVKDAIRELLEIAGS